MRWTLVAILLTGCVRAPLPEAARAPAAIAPTTAIAPTDDAPAYAALVTTLADEAMEGRGPGTAGLAAARDLLVDRLAAAGLRPAFGGSFTQRFHIALDIEVTEETLAVNGAPIRAEAIHPLGFGANGAFEGPLAFVGYGIVDAERGYDSYAGLEPDALRGKVVVMYRYEPMDDDGDSRWHPTGWTAGSHLTTKVGLAADRGAAAVILVNPPARRAATMHSTLSSAYGSRAPVPAMMISYDAFKLMLHRAGVRQIELTARQWEKRANDGELRPVDLDAAARGRIRLAARLAPGDNVAGFVPGAGALADQVVVVGAHYDHLGQGERGSLARDHALHPGADDNASGTAAVVLLAERYARLVRGGFAPDARRTVLFILFSGEEYGLVGSGYFTRHLDDAALHPDRITAMVNFDMVGRLRDDRLYVMGTDTAAAWRALIEAAAADEGLTVSTGGDGAGPSDHASFVRLGIPGVHVFTGLHADYHRPTDTADKINAAGGARVVAMAERLLAALAGPASPIGPR